MLDILRGGFPSLTFVLDLTCWGWGAGLALLRLFLLWANLGLKGVYWFSLGSSWSSFFLVLREGWK